MKRKIQFEILGIIFPAMSWEQSLDPVNKAVNETKDLLQGNTWTLEQFTIQVTMGGYQQLLQMG